MDSRKFYFILTAIISVFLFVCGAALLAYLNTPGDENNTLDIFDSVKSNNTPVNILVMGGDKVNKNSDTLILVNLDPISDRLNIMSIPRDTKVNVKGATIPKINSAYPAGGAERAVETVHNLLNVNINYYVFVDTSSMAKIIDTLGGVDFNVPADMNYEDPVQSLYIHLKKGMQHLNGSQVVQYMRFRHPNNWTGEIGKYYDGSDVKRIEAQQKLIREILRQKVTLAYFSKVNDILNIVFKNIETNITLSEALNMSQNLSKINKDKVNMLVLPGNPVEEQYSYFIVDKVKANKIVDEFFQSPSFYSNTSNKKKTTGSTGGSNDHSNNVKSSEPQSTPVKTPEPVQTDNPGNTTTIDVTDGNPSNSETDMQGTTSPMP